MSKQQSKDKDIDDDDKIKIFKENLTCSVLKKNYIDDQTLLLGYPIVQTKNKFNQNKFELYPIPEMLSYEGFLKEIDNQQQKLDLYFETNFTTKNNEVYNCWIPVYINKKHYEKNKTHILNSFSIIKYGPEGKAEYDFKPEQIFEVLPVVLNKMIIGMFNGKSEISSAFIRSYFQYVLLFKKLCDDYEDENLAFINKKLSVIFDNEYKIDKKIVPDIGDFLMILFYCNRDTHGKEMKKMWDCIFEEFIIRAMFWIFHADENREKMKKIVLKTQNNETCLRKFQNERNFKIWHLDKFVEDLNKAKIYDQIVDIISNDEKYLKSIVVGKDQAKEQVINRIGRTFKYLYNECSDEAQKQIIDLITKNLNFADYFNYVDDELYNQIKVDELLSNKNLLNADEIVETAYESQRGNKLLLITFFAQKKVDEEGFLKELEDNYGIYLKVDEFIEEMNKKLAEIKTYKQLLEYVGSDIYKDKSDIEIIIDAYGKAKEKGYIKSVNNNENGQINIFGRNIRPINNINNFTRNNFNHFNNRGGYRGRGSRGRGYRGWGRGRGGRGRGRGRGRGNFGRRDFNPRQNNSSRSLSRSRSRSNSR